MFRTKGSGVKNGAKKGGLVAAAVMTIALPFTAQHEGLRLKAYLDPVGIPTICYGETKNVELGQVKSRQECDEMLAVRLAWFGYQVDQLVMPEMAPETHAALTSFAYNIGVGAFKNSTALRKMNTGDQVGGCKAIATKIIREDGRCVGYGCGRAGGKLWAGLQKRRQQESKLCLKGVSDTMNATGGNI